MLASVCRTHALAVEVRVSAARSLSIDDFVTTCNRDAPSRLHLPGDELRARCGMTKSRLEVLASVFTTTNTAEQLLSVQ